jgi:hypothetical protein
MYTIYIIFLYSKTKGCQIFSPFSRNRLLAIILFSIKRWITYDAIRHIWALSCFCRWRLLRGIIFCLSAEKRAFSSMQPYSYVCMHVCMYAKSRQFYIITNTEQHFCCKLWWWVGIIQMQTKNSAGFNGKQKFNLKLSKVECYNQNVF